MDEEQSKMVREYMEGKAMLKELAEKLSEIEPKVKALVIEVGLPIEGELGKLSVSEQPRWTYPQSIVDKELEVKNLKEVAKQKAGTEEGAVSTTIQVMKFTQKKAKV